MSTAAVFLDRDGTLIDDPGYLADPAQVRLLPGVAAAVRAMEVAGYLRIIVTNQSGIGRQRYSIEQFLVVQREVGRQLTELGASVDATYYCPHNPDAGCTCRKPGTALYREAIARFDVDAAASWCVGNQLRDVVPAVELGMRAILLGSSLAPADQPGLLHAPDLAAGSDLLPRYLGAP
jgi:histidinol-phosphate phosphatase family protein